MNATTPSGSSAATAVVTGRSRSRQSTPRLLVLVGGLVCVLAGLAMLVFLWWEYVGTDLVAHHRQSDIRADLRASWGYPTVADVLGPQTAVAPLGTADALLRIPRFGADYEVPVIEGVRDVDLSQGVGHFPGTGPGQIGNFALAGHRATNGEPFKQLPELRPGDEVIVETAQATYTYQLDTNPNGLVVPFTEGWVIDPVPAAPDDEAPPGMRTFESVEPTDALVTLTSSSELFSGDDRMVAFGHLVKTTPK